MFHVRMIVMLFNCSSRPVSAYQLRKTKLLRKPHAHNVKWTTPRPSALAHHQTVLEVCQVWGVEAIDTKDEHLPNDLKDGNETLT